MAKACLVSLLRWTGEEEAQWTGLNGFYSRIHLRIYIQSPGHPRSTECESARTWLGMVMSLKGQKHWKGGVGWDGVEA